MVSYYMNKAIKVADLKEKGYEVIDNRGKKGEFPVIIKKEDSWLAIDESNFKNIDDVVFYRLEGRGFAGGLDIMLDIAEDFDLKFMNDEEYELLYFYEKHDFEKEDEEKLFEERCDAYMNDIKKTIEDFEDENTDSDTVQE